MFGTAIKHDSRKKHTDLPTSFVIALGLATVICLATASLGALHMLYISMYITQSGRRLFIVYLANTAPGKMEVLSMN
ncbi:unnamed protein product [Nippostrongylus brasiliensis]|uniref:Vesicle transport protein n=1 Tax=Nippostrongylus brasiliensis TaxID=27835 RepID=A0A0N4YCS2_NIPBR|nr:unnamed protein product [Nippostrongylus brasiliensis]